MPLLDDVMDNKVFGPKLRRALAQGREEGRHDGELTVLLRQAEKRFGPVPDTVRTRLEKMSDAELEAAALRLLDARTVEELLD